MKQLICEMCGGRDLIKNEGVFVCQNCGAKYSVEDAKKMMVEGTVTVDRSTDINNLLIRAKQFEERGDYGKADEYYNKVLDLDPSNEEALNGLSSASDEYSDSIEDVFFVEKDISSEECIKNFFYSLSKKKNVAKYIFSNMKIKSVSEKSQVFLISVAECEGDYNGTACYRHEVPYTDYKDETIRKNDGTYETRKVPVTKYRTETEKQPASGSFETTVASVSTLSAPLYNFFNADAERESDEGELTENSNSGAIVLEGLEDTVKYGFLHDSLVKLFTAYEAEEYATGENEDAFGTFEKAEACNDERLLQIAIEKFKIEISNGCYSAACYTCPGEYSENVIENHRVTSTDSCSIIVPVHIIEYEYGNKTFYAAQVMSKNICEPSMSYPLDNESAEKEESLRRNKDEMIPKPLSIGVSKFIFGAAGFAAFVAWINGEFWWLVTIALAVLGIFLYVKGKKEYIDNIQKSDEAFVNTKKQLTDAKTLIKNSYNILINSYDGSKDFDAALESVKSAYPLEVTEDFDFDYAWIKQKNEDENVHEDKACTGMVVISVGRRRSIIDGLKIYVNDEELDEEIRGCDRIEIPLYDDSTVKLMRRYSKDTAETFVAPKDEICIVHVDYSILGLSVKKTEKQISVDDKEAVLNFEKEFLCEIERQKKEKLEKIGPLMKRKEKIESFNGTDIINKLTEVPDKPSKFDKIMKRIAISIGVIVGAILVFGIAVALIFSE